MATVPIKIDLDKILEVALKGVRRASVFMGLGVNAAINKDFKNYQLTPLTNIQLVPDNISEDSVNHIKEEFRIWIEAGGFRELADTFSVYLDSVHHACYVMKSVKDGASVSEVTGANFKYRGQGLPNKLNILNQRFCVRPNHEYQLISLSKARNCLTHRNGIVEDEDLRGESEFVVRWYGVDLFIEEPNGNRHLLGEMPPDGLYLSEGGSVKMQFVERVRSFNRGDRLMLSTRDLAEVCWFYDREARAVLASVMGFASSIGVEVNQK